MLAITGPSYGLALLRSGIDRVLRSGFSLASKVPKATTYAAETGLFSGLKQLAVGVVNSIKSWI